MARGQKCRKQRVPKSICLRTTTVAADRWASGTGNVPLEGRVSTLEGHFFMV